MNRAKTTIYGICLAHVIWLKSLSSRRGLGEWIGVVVYIYSTLPPREALLMVALFHTVGPFI